jgi:hypothetical protein
MSVEKVKRRSGEVVFPSSLAGGDAEPGAHLLVTPRRQGLRRRAAAARRAGSLAQLDRGRETLDEYVTSTWAPTHAPAPAPNTRSVYAIVYDKHVVPYVGSVELREITPERIARWQTDRLASGVGPHAVRKALAVLGSILQRATEGASSTTRRAWLARRRCHSAMRSGRSPCRR